MEAIPAWNNLEFICHGVASWVYLAASSLLFHLCCRERLKMNSFRASSTWESPLRPLTPSRWENSISTTLQLQSRQALNVIVWHFLFSLPSFLPHTLEFQWLRQPSAVSVLNSGSVSPAGERICKTKHVFLLPAAKPISFPQRNGEALPSTLRCTQGICHWFWLNLELFLLLWGLVGEGGGGIQN